MAGILFKGKKKCTWHVVYDNAESWTIVFIPSLEKSMAFQIAVSESITSLTLKYTFAAHSR